MRTLLVARIAVIAATVASLAACGAGQSAREGTRAPPSTGTVTPSAAPPATVQPSTPSPQPSGTTAPAPPGTTAPAPPGTQPVTGWLAGKDWTAISTTRRVVALTFDAGANADAVPSILATLRRENATATFFLTGNFVRDYPAAARSIAAAGFRIGNHTISHPHLTQLSDAAVRREILGGARQISSVTGKDPAPLFRFPFGDSDARTITLANQAGYVPVRWTVDTLGWQGTAGDVTASVVVSRVLSAARPGEIVLMHVGSNPDDHTTFDADALPAVISGLRAQGYSFVTLDALTG
ncbi:MAG TPA: polysaccharide deacetylase family protein [Trebonia sp.]|jgi:peptidoglycan/xylan/chitin deacetylase (PgdA/CDA1 family)|nr:polysaccharide deacetylase family protein [Trebonia sp.]